jgi:hypothetical protein
LLLFRVVCCDDVYDVLWCIVDCASNRVSKRGHFGLVCRPWEEPRTYFEVVVIEFWFFVIAIVFFVSEFLV